MPNFFKPPKINEQGMKITHTRISLKQVKWYKARIKNLEAQIEESYYKIMYDDVMERYTNLLHEKQKPIEEFYNKQVKFFEAKSAVTMPEGSMC